MQIPITIACLVLLAPLWAADKYVICPSDNGMTNEVRNMFVDTHNKLRSQTAQGKAKNAFGGFAPKAARMLKVVRHDNSSSQGRSLQLCLKPVIVRQ
nr:SCP extracellular domain containing protein [Haemonchus contortus]